MTQTPVLNITIQNVITVAGNKIASNEKNTLLPSLLWMASTSACIPVTKPINGDSIAYKMHTKEINQLSGRRVIVKSIANKIANGQAISIHNATLCKLPPYSRLWLVRFQNL